MQSLVNGVYGIVAGFGLFFLGVPYPLVLTETRDYLAGLVEVPRPGEVAVA